jgi:hypothetical protein
MKIHSKKLEQTNDGSGIYYDNIKITDKRTGLNEYTSFEEWIEIISKNENFNPKKYHPELFGEQPELL